ncbi:uncharacterized protein LOC142235629 [Haematobia irritans]|uniref:uncharacterized protein LOC142235629 n=1 Tax=Haematobia irritans TaxID=7368 RepID=UPI003F508011
MITQGSSYALWKNLNLLDEPCANLTRDDVLQNGRQDIRKHIRKAYETNQKQYNLRSRLPTFKIGQEVFRRNFAQSSMEKGFNAKLSPVFLKARIRAKVGNQYYIVADLEGKDLGFFHAKDIRS